MTLHLDLSRRPEWLPPLRAPPSPRRQPTDGMNLIEKRAYQIQQRIEALESGRKTLGPHEKWPTVTAVRQFRERESKPTLENSYQNHRQSLPILPSRRYSTLLSDNSSPNSSLAPPNPRQPLWAASRRYSTMSSNTSLGSSPYSPPAPSSSRQSMIWPASHRRYSARITTDSVLIPPDTPPAPFPYPITRHKPLASFTLFSDLPPEIRLLIWETALESPKFIEVQFGTEWYEPTFINWGRYSIFFYICRESREVAIAARAANITHTRKALRELSSMPQNLNMRQDYRWPHPHVSEDRQLGTPYTAQEKKSRWPNGFIRFIPDRDTIFLRTLDNATFSLGTMGWRIAGVEKIQHLAIPLDKKGLPSKSEWSNMLLQLRALKTITFMIGSEEKSWKGEKPIELKELEQWFADGRYRLIRNGRERMDIADVGAYLMGKDFHRPPPRGAPSEIKRAGISPASKIINVRVVAWKRR